MSFLNIYDYFGRHYYVICFPICLGTKAVYKLLEGQTLSSSLIHKETLRVLMATSSTGLVVKVRFGQEVRRLPLAQDEQYQTLVAKVSAHNPSPPHCQH